MEKLHEIIDSGFIGSYSPLSWNFLCDSNDRIGLKNLKYIYNIIYIVIIYIKHKYILVFFQ